MMDLLGSFSSQQTVSITTNWKNFPPIASFIGSVNAFENALLTINGISGVDPDEGKQLDYWIYQSPDKGKKY